MSRRGPLLTLLSGAGLAAVLLAASIQAAGGQPERPDPAARGDAAAPTRPAEATASPDPSDPSGQDAEDAEDADPDGEPVTYVGWVDGDTASVAVLVTGDEATAYVCDGDAVETWLTGPAAGGELRLESETGETLTASYDDQQATGRTDAGGQEWTFTLEAGEAPEGLYRFADTVAGAEVRGGWIVLPDGTQVGLLTVAGDTAPAPPLNPDTGAVEVADRMVFADRLGGWADR